MIQNTYKEKSSWNFIEEYIHEVKSYCNSTVQNISELKPCNSILQNIYKLKSSCNSMVQNIYELKSSCNCTAQNIYESYHNTIHV